MAAMALDAATIRIALQADASNMVSGFAAGTAAAGGFERAVTRSLQNVRSAYDRMSGSQKAIAGAAVAGTALAVAMRAVVGPAIAFESAFAGVRKTVDGSPAQLEGIRQGLLDMSSVMPTTAEELAAIAENAGQLGVAAPQVLEFTRTVAMLGETTDLDFEEAAQSLARFLNITGSGAEGIGAVADVIVELGNNSATTESQIVNFSTRLASAFTTAGATEDEILAIAAAFSSMGIRAEAGGSALSKIITSISDAAIDGGQDLQTYAEVAGIVPEQFREIARNSPVEALVLVGEGMARLREEGGSITPVLQDLELGGLRTSEIFRLLSLNTDQVRDALGLASGQMENGGAAAEEYGKRIETTASRIDILRNRINTLAIEIGTPTLDVLALSADKAGDAIVALADLLAPLGAEVGATFGNMGEAAAIFFDVIGGPALRVATAGLVAVASSAEALLEAFNSLGPAGTVAAVAILAIATNATAVRTAVAGLALSLQLAGVSATGMAAASTAATAALAVAPYAAAALALAAVGKSYLDAGTQAKEAAAGFRAAAETALQSGTYQEVVTSLENLVVAYDEAAAASAGIESGRGSWERLGQAIVGTGQVLTPFTENTVQNATRSMEELDRVIGDLRLGNFDDSVRLAAQALDLTEDEVVTLAREMGVLGDLTQGTTGQFYESIDAMALQVAATRELADRTGVAAEKIMDGTATLGDFSRAMGLTTDELEFLTTKIDDVDLDDFLDEEKLDGASSAVQSLLAAYGELADQVGLSTSAFIDQLQSVSDLAAAHDRLESAISGARSALELIEAQEQRVTEATQQYDEALQGIDGSLPSLRNAAEATRDLTLAYAASGAELPAVIQYQAELREELIANAQSFGMTRAEATEFIDVLALVPPAVLAEIVLEAEAATAETEAVRQLLEDTAGIYDVLLQVEDEEARARIAETRADSEAWAFADWIAELNVESPQAQAEIQARHEQARQFAEDFFQALLLADGSAAEAETAARSGQARDFAGADYTAFLEANGAQAQRETSARQAQADGYAGTYNATLTATDNASSVIGRAVSALRGFASRTITLTTVRRTVGGSTSGTQSADGNLLVGRAHMMNDGGALGGVPERRGTAGIYGPRMPYRVFFGEPETEGEAYIPLAASKRDRSLRIWAETGRMLGAMADGGIGGASGARPVSGSNLMVTMAPNITVDARGVEGLDADAVAALVEARVGRALGAQARQLSEQRLLV